MTPQPSPDYRQNIKKKWINNVIQRVEDLYNQIFLQVSKTNWKKHYLFIILKKTNREWRNFRLLVKRETFGSWFYASSELRTSRGLRGQPSTAVHSLTLTGELYFMLFSSFSPPSFPVSTLIGGLKLLWLWGYSEVVNVTHCWAVRQNGVKWATFLFGSLHHYNIITG